MSDKMSNSDNLKEEVRLHNDIVDVISSHVEVQRAGKNFKALCPFHQEKTPSFIISPERQTFHCFGCGVGGDVFRFIMEYEKMEFREALELLADRAGISVTFEKSKGGGINRNRLYQLNEKAAVFYHQTLAKPEGEEGTAYLKERQLTDESIRGFQIGFAPNSWDTLIHRANKWGFSREELEQAGLIGVSTKGNKKYYFDRFRNRLMFPVSNAIGKIIGFSGRVIAPQSKGAKYVNTPETPIFHKSRVLFAMDKARRKIAETRSAYIVEGQLDAIRCHEVGLNQVVASQGTALTPNHARLLKRYCDDITLILDSDSAGQNAALKAINTFLAAELDVGIVTLPDGEDPDSIIRDQGGEALENLIKERQNALAFQISILRKRDDLQTTAGLMRTVREVATTLGQTPNAVQRERMTKQAAKALDISSASLVKELQRNKKQKNQPAKESGADQAKKTPQSYPFAEKELLKLLANKNDEVRDLVCKYLPLHELTHKTSQTIAQILLEHPAVELINHLASDNLSAQQLATRIQTEPERIDYEETPPQQVALDLIKDIRLKSSKQKLKKLREKRNPGETNTQIEQKIASLYILQGHLKTNNWNAIERLSQDS